MDSAASYPFFKEEIKSWVIAHFDQSSAILDVGAGSGTYYNLLHDHFKNIDCVEVYKPNIEYYNLSAKYRKVFHEDIRNFEYDYYDLIIFGDVLEHLTTEQAQRVLAYAEQKCKNAIVAVPYLYPQEANENKYEEHLQPDLTPEVVKERYPNLVLLYGDSNYGYYIINKN